MLFQQVICKKRASVLGLSHILSSILVLCSVGIFAASATANALNADASTLIATNTELPPISAKKVSGTKGDAKKAVDETASVEMISAEDVNAVKNMLGQKIILDFRYFCEDDTPSSRCRTPMTEIPSSLLSVLSTHNIGGVILFSENIQNAEQLITLNYSMQQHMVNAGRQPLFIAVDQEGGRVARLPSDMLSPFAGNMAIGATFHQRGNAFAQSVASHIGQTLLPLGINTNFAPSLDVNSEPKNPVINVRSFSENPEQVAALGRTFVSAMQSTGVLSAIKHFPGHGDTHVDSHSGLPQVTHTKAQAMAGDILPFANIINSATPPAMVMSAHIQYPSLDDTEILDKNGKLQIVPATLSKKILTDMLRKQLGYKGLVVTDALDMAGITQFFSHEEALVRAFSAGADIALMPFTIRNKTDIDAFSKLLDKVAVRLVNKSTDSFSESAFLVPSFNRILEVKQQFNLESFVSKPVSWWLNEAKENTSIDNPNSLKNKGIQIEKALSRASVSVLYGKGKLPLTSTRWLALMPDAARCLAFESALMQASSKSTNKPLEFACLPLTALPKQQLAMNLLKQADVLVVGNISPLHANYELGGFDLPTHVKRRASELDVMAFSKMMMTAAKTKNKTVVFAPLRMPYKAKDLKNVADIAIATFSYAISIDRQGNKGDNKVTSYSLKALADVLVGNVHAEGRSPVSLE
ncbi:beta-hexosaminidase [Alteromonas sp. BL110]|uniref:glycoside hydrolase family 3 N-terminal domain-containing protein n=1 Tax=Alteromonas sp. BL110 TaxID=1714845 RepID=UPI000E5119AD|nr:glycoside hydrolase family 3 N-terminal domain-containing protein [Alteromonas sp. BL110]AXT38095.1 beta-hexosaminidase [Alteromonas sp. BL110]RKM80838.1 beta-hexosaminidase [Alteromonas sp. BL110]